MTKDHRGSIRYSTIAKLRYSRNANIVAEDPARNQGRVKICSK